MADQLDEYRRKRDFARTPEPAPRASDGASSTPRFVIQRHDARAVHYDLRLEHEGALESWAVPKGLPLRAGDKRLAVRTEPHPLEYLTFAGTIPSGQYGAGRMSIWDEGTYEPIAFGPDEVKIVLHGAVATGEYHLVRTGDDGGRSQWLLFRATAAGPGGVDPAERFRSLRPMLASVAAEPFDDPAWSFEIKWDGYRALVMVTSEGTQIRSRTGRDMTARFPRLGDLRREVDAQEVVIDGEICALDEAGRAVFQDLQSSSRPVTLVAFDLLHVDGRWLLDRPYTERRDELRRVLTPGADGKLMLSDDVLGEGRSLFAAIAARGGEGLVAKRRASVYAPGGRGSDWRKIKVRTEVEGVICGFMPGEGSRRDTFGALVIGRRTDAGLTYIGRAGSGFTEASTRDLRHRLDRLVSDDCPFSRPPRDVKGVQWVRPVLGCRVSYGELTNDGQMRSPVFIGLVEHEPAERSGTVLDLTAPELRVRDGDREVRLTNLGKPFWSVKGITKGDVLDHYARVAPFLVPHLAGRPMVLKRYPNGWDAAHFFQHALPDTAPDWLRRVTLRRGGEDVTYAVVDDPLSLLWVVNLGCIDLNPTHARAATPQLADYVLFDLDPQEGVTVDELFETALLVREALAEVGLRCHAKTSGSRGVHVLVPVEPIGHESVRLFSQVIAQRIVARRPDLVTVEMAKARRGRRVYIDTNQNGEGKTIASVYSLRPVAAASVSTPLEWDEVVAGVDPALFTMAAVAQRVSDRGDLFAPVLRRDQDLAAAIGALDA